MILFNNLLLTIALFWITFFHNCSATKKINSETPEEDNENRAKTLCIEHLATEYNTDENAGPENFKKTFSQMSMQGLKNELGKPKINEDDIAKIQRLFKREVLKNYMHDLLLSIYLMGLKGMQIPEKWCADKLSTVMEIIQKTSSIKEKTELQLKDDCERFTQEMLGISLTEGKSYLFHHGYVQNLTNYIFNGEPESVFEILFLQWSYPILNYNTLIGVSPPPPDKETDESLENHFYIKHFSLAYFQHYEEFVNNYNYINNCVNGECSYVSVNNFCGYAAKPLLDYVEKELVNNPNE